MASSDSDKAESHGSIVASHYNKLEEIGIEARKESRILHMRGFNNWIKSTLINDFIVRLRKKDPSRLLTVLDLASGKGGDQKKWQIARVYKVIHADIAETSVQQSEDRYKKTKVKENPRYPMFSAEFHVADCTKELLSDKYPNREQQIDLTSCQFAFHYSFESLAQADMMLRNACERLRVGGYFIGTTPDARELIKRLHAAPGLSFGNDVYSATFTSKTEFPLFGCKYDFHLEGVVDCPEFLVHFGCVEKLAKKYGMVLVYKQNFAELCTEKVKNPEYLKLLHRMSALEEFPAPTGKQLASQNPNSYISAQKQLALYSPDKKPKLWTLSQEEWEATTVYLAFAFQKLEEPSVEESVSKQNRKRPAEFPLERDSASTAKEPRFIT